MKLALAIAASLIASAAVAHDAPPTTKPAEAPMSTTTDQQKQAKPVRQHSGGTDANGCHTNHQTGEYHCHRPK